MLSISTGFPYCWRRTGFRFLRLRFGWTMKTGRLGRYVCKARQGDAMRGKAQLPASSMQLTVAVTVTVTATGASGANVATVTGPDGQPGDGLSKAWLWWIGKGVTGWRRTIADAAFANTKSCRKGLDGTARRTERQTEGRGEATVEVGNRIQYRGRRRSRSWCCLFVRSRLASLGRLLWMEEGGAADPFTSLFSPSRPMEPELLREGE